MREELFDPLIDSDNRNRRPQYMIYFPRGIKTYHVFAELEDPDPNYMDAYFKQLEDAGYTYASGTNNLRVKYGMNYAVGHL